MPRRSILSAAERESLLALPDSPDDLIRRYTFSESDLSTIRQRRGAANRLGFALQLCYLRFPGVVLGVDQLPFPPLLHLAAGQLKIPVEHWAEYGSRAQTRREHLVELQTAFGFEPFTAAHHKLAVQELIETAMHTDKGIVLANRLVERLRQRTILLPRLNAIERVCAEAITRANRRIYKQLTDGADRCSPRAAGPTARAERRQQHDLARMASPVAAQAKLQAHARTHRPTPDMACSRSALRD